MNRTLVLLYAAVLSASACQSSPTLDVRTDNKKLDGVPFFVKVPEYTRTTSYEARWVEATLRIKRRGEPDMVVSRVLPEGARAELRDLAQAIVEAKQRVESAQDEARDRWNGEPQAESRGEQFSTRSTEVRRYAESVDALRASPADDAKLRAAARALDELLKRTLSDTADDLIGRFTRINSGQDLDVEADLAQPNGTIQRRRTANTLVLSSRIDYDNPHYINARVRPFATTTQTVKLNGDLLLSETTTAVDTTKQLEAITSLLPIKEFLTAELIPVPPAAAEALFNAPGGSPPIAVPVTLTLSVETRGYSYVFTASGRSRYEVGAMLAFDTAQHAFKRTPLGAGSVNEKKDGDTNAISFAGSVQLPKTDAAKP